MGQPGGKIPHLALIIDDIIGHACGVLFDVFMSVC